jgi:uncharacterized protein YdhG (YjbR/CyaY superfamily)
MDQGAISPNLKANRIALGQILLKARWKRVAVMAKTASSSKSKASEKFSAAERQAMKDRAQELKNKAKGLKGEAELMEKVKLMNKEDKELALAIHKLITSIAPELEPKTWYGMPAYYKNGKVLVFFQNAGKWKSRYSTLGFDESANLDSGSMWPTSFALTKLTPANKKAITDLVLKAIR